VTNSTSHRLKEAVSLLSMALPRISNGRAMKSARHYDANGGLLPVFAKKAFHLSKR
jgi:hypothetical protein